ncbi:MAG: type II secretion system GspH family protein, partial [Candidatus Magnetoovum sp. WYHC-5]|nr:type II secretion system GspH family protein [Candidatus Magnetoovum sp. WYHC-5]
MFKQVKVVLHLQDGLTLIEMAVVLVIVGIILGMGANLLGPLIDMQNVNKTKNIVDAARESVIGYTAQNKRLPTSSEFKGVVTKAIDGWNQNLLYLIDSTLGSTNNICGRKTTSVTVRSCIDNSNCASGTANVDYVDIKNIAFLAASNGSDYILETNTSSSPIMVYKNEKIGDTTYDDIVIWTTLGELRTQIGCSGEPLRIINNELPYGYAGTNYNAAIYVEGGSNTSMYKWCLDTSNYPGGYTDPTPGCVVPANCSSSVDTTWASAS